MAGNPKFGERIRRLRQDKQKTDPKFSLRQFAQMVGISATFLSKVENGEFDPPKAEKIKKMAELLGADPDELLALAKKVDPELSGIIMKKPKVMADFLRMANRLSANELKAITQEIREKKDKDER